MSPTGAVGGALGAALVLHLLGRVSEGEWLALASAAALALPLAGLLLRPRLDGVEVRCSPVRSRAGESVEVELRVRNTSSRPTRPLRLEDRTPGLAPVTVAVPSLPPGAEVRAPVVREVTARGAADAFAVELRATDPFGMVSVRRSLEPAGPLVIGPRRVTAAELDLAGAGTGGLRSRPSAGSGTEVLGLRPWRPGDARRAVHARSSARHGQPVVLEREREAGPALVVLCAGVGQGQEWEAAVAASCALAEEALLAGRRLTLVASGAALPGRPDLATVLAWHASLERSAPLDEAGTDAALRATERGGTLLVLAGRRHPEALLPLRRRAAAAAVQVTVLGDG